jgi:hypothetical protein
MSDQAGPNRRETLLQLVALSSSLGLSACGGGGSGGDASAPGAGPALVFNQSEPAVAPGRTSSVQVLRRSPDGSLQDVSLLARWQSSNPAVMTAGVSGEIRGVAEGSAVLTATFEGSTASVTVRVGTFAVGLEFIQSQLLALGIGGEWQMYPTVHTTVGSTTGAVQLVTWSSSDESVASIGTSGPMAGVVRGRAPGEVTITGRVERVSATLRLRVHDHEVLYTRQPTLVQDQCRIAVDAADRGLAVWARGAGRDSGQTLEWSACQPGQRWSAPRPIRVDGAVPPRTFGLSVSRFEAGFLVATWMQLEGLFAARFSHADGWERPQLVAPEVRAMSVSEWTFVNLSDRGDALIMWRDVGSGPGYWFSSRARDAAGWTVPARVPTSLPSPDRIERFVAHGNPAGHAVLVRSIDAPMTLDPALQRKAEVKASRWTDGAWQDEELVAELPGPARYLDVSSDTDGAVFVAWAMQAVALGSVHLRRYASSTSWQAIETIAEDRGATPADVKVASRAGHGVGVLWLNTFDYATFASVSNRSGPWSTPFQVSAGDSFAAPVGAPTLLPPLMDQAGRFVVSWLADDFAITGRLATRVRLNDGTWGSTKRAPYGGRVGSISTWALHWQDNATMAALWGEDRTDSYELSVMRGYVA